MNIKQPIYQLKITLNGIKPPIWRRILVPANIDLVSLHDLLQIVIGWTNSHLHQFISGKKLYGIQDDEFGDFDMDIENEDKYELSQLLRRENDSLKYEYDFGDGWEHKIVLEKILPYETTERIPRCIKGKRACPPEDCGGIWGFENLIEAIKDSSHPEHEEMVEWLGRDFDSENFNLDEINKLLQENFPAIIVSMRNNLIPEKPVATHRPDRSYSG